MMLGMEVNALTLFPFAASTSMLQLAAVSRACPRLIDPNAEGATVAPLNIPSAVERRGVTVPLPLMAARSPSNGENWPPAAKYWPLRPP